MIEIPRTHSTFHLINGSKCFQSPLTQTLSQRWPVPAQFVKDLPPITDILWHLTSLSSLLRIVYCRAGIYLWPEPSTHGVGGTTCSFSVRETKVTQSPKRGTGDSLAIIVRTDRPPSLMIWYPTRVDEITLLCSVTGAVVWWVWRVCTISDNVISSWSRIPDGDH